MASNFNVERGRRGPGHFVSLEGVIDETLGVDALVCEGGGPVVYDLDRVHRVTSFGVRQWMAALRALGSASYAFVRARPAIVRQFNMVAGFGGTGVLVSMYLPYLCLDCDELTDVLLDLRHDYARVLENEHPGIPCAHCGGETEFDAFPEDYFSYVRSQPAPTLTSGLRAVLGEPSEPAPARLSLRKEVDSLVTAFWFAGPLDTSRRLQRHLEGAEGHVVLEMSQITGASTPAVRALLAALLDAPPESITCVRVPSEQVAAWAHASVPPVIGSVLVRVHCEHCAFDGTAELDEAGLNAAVAVEAPSAECPHCGRTARITSPPLELVAARTRLAPLVPEVLAYLTKRPPFSVTSDSASQHREWERDTLLASRYERIAKVGSGGMAEVYLARQRGLEGFQKKVVLKTILPNRRHNLQATTMFLREARLAARISHPNVVQIFDLGRSENGLFIVMEYVDGWDLRGVLKQVARRNAIVPEILACRIIADLCAGLHAAHSATDENGEPCCIVHRDVSPHNVMLAADGSVKVADFGVASVRSKLSKAEGQREVLSGKIPYMSPEQLRGEPAGPATDIFAAGIVFHELLTLRNPFRGDNEAATMWAIQQGLTDSLEVCHRDLDEEVVALVRKALALEPSARFADAEEMRMALERHIAAREPTTSAHVGRWLRDLMRDKVPTGYAIEGSASDDATDLDIDYETVALSSVSARRNIASVSEPSDSDVDDLRRDDGGKR